MKLFFKTKSFIIGVLSAAGITAALAAGVPQKIVTDSLVLGKASSTDPKVIEFNTGDSPNILLRVDDSQNGSMTTNQFTLGDGTDTAQSLIFDQSTADITFGVDGAQNAIINSDQLQVGDGTGSDKTLLFNIGGSDPFIRWDDTNSRLVFSNDGSAEKAIGSGSGSGGGTNVLADDNADFEVGSPPSSWTASGGTFISETSSPLYGDQSGSWDASGLGQTLDSVLAPIKEGFIDGKCQAEIFYKYASGAAGDYKLVARQFDDSGATEISVAEVDLSVTGTQTLLGQLFFDCPDDVADDLRVRVEAGVADPGIIIVDNSFIGTGRNTFQLSQTDIFGTWFMEGAASCVFSTTSGTYTAFANDSDCNTPTVTGRLALADNPKTPAFKVAQLPAGKYEIVWVGNQIANFSSTSTNCLFSVSDGTTEKGFMTLRDADGVIGDADRGTTMVSFFEYATAQTDITFNVVGQRGSGDGTCDVELTAAGLNGEFTVKRFPVNSAEAITLETVGEHWDVNIGGDHMDLSTSDVTSYTEITDGSVDMVINAGSKTAQIPCSTTNPSSGLTCAAGNEGFGIVIDVATAGRYRVCGEFTREINLPTDGSNNDVQSYFQWMETPNNAQTILQTGNTRKASGLFTGSSNAAIDAVIYPHSNCGTFNFASPGQKTLRLMYAQTAPAGTVDQNRILADRSGTTLGDRDIHITVDKLDQQMPTPVFTDLQNSFTDLENSLTSKVETDAAASDIRMVSALISNPGSPSIARQDGAWIDSVTDVSTGETTINIAAGVFSVAPNCVVSCLRGTNCNPLIKSNTTTSSVDVRTENPSLADLDATFFITCIGPK